MSQATKQEFGKWRSFFWPVHGFELKKLLPMFLMFFFISFISFLLFYLYINNLQILIPH